MSTLAHFSDDGKHYTHMYFGPQTVPTLTLCAVGGACNPVWKANDEIAEYGLRRRSSWSSRRTTERRCTGGYSCLRIAQRAERFR